MPKDEENNMKRCVIVGAAKIADYKTIKSFLHNDDFFAICDGGLFHCEPLGIQPDLVVGDFDSHEMIHSNVETILLPRAKDDTDSVFAVKEALKRGFCDFVLIGAAGGRLDHTLVNISVLLMLHKLNKTAVLIDDYSEMQIAGQSETFIADSYSYFSLLNIGPDAKGVTIKNAKFTLNDAQITLDYQYATSNEVLRGKTASVFVKSGCLLLIKVR